MSDELKRFYRELWAWVQDGCPDHEVFRKDDAICGNLDLFMGVRISLAKENKENMRLLLGAFGDCCFPFNSSAEDFVKEKRNCSYYQNPKRLAFIEEHAK